MPLRNFTDAEILVSERRRLEQPLVVLVWAGVVLFSLAEPAKQGGPSVFFLIAGTVAAGIKLQAISRGKELLLRPLLVNVGVLLATGVVLLSLWLRAYDPVIAIGHYAILIQLCKLFERSRNRDCAQVLALSMLTVMASCLTSERLWFAGAVAVYLGLACYTAMILTLKRGLDGAVEACLPTEAGPLPAHKVAWNVRRDWPARSLRRKLVPILLTMAAVGALFFVVAPRTRLISGMVPRSEKSSAVTGFADTVRLGDAKTIYLSDHVAMNVRLSTAPGQRLQLPGPLYLRGHVLEIYQNSQWSPRRGTRFEPCPPAEDLRPGGGPPQAGMLRMESNMLRTFPLTTLFGLHPARRAWADSTMLEVTASKEWRVPGPREGEWVDYVMESSLVQDANADEPPPATAWGLGIDRQVREEAARWCRDLLTQREALADRPGDQTERRNQFNLAIAQRIAQRLQSGFQYSLDVSTCDANDDGVHDFLFRMKQGHCEYFASAMTVMCRALSVPARLATGFRLDEFGAPGEWQAVRDRDAHAWTEVYDHARGWVVFDATPAGPPQPVDQHWWSFLSRGWDDADQAWTQRVVRFSVQDQAYLTNQIKRWFRDVYDALQKGLMALISSEAVDWAILDVVIAMGAVAAVVEAMILVHLIRRKTQASRALRRATGDRWRQVRFLARFLRLLARNGVSARPEMTLLETVRLATDPLGLPADQALGLIRLYYRLRWGAQDIASAEIAAAEATVESWAHALPRRKRVTPGTGTGV